MEFHNNLRKWRKSRDLKQYVLAQVCGVVQQTYSSYETGKLPVPLHILQLLAKFYDIPISALLDEHEPTPRPVLDAKHQELYEKLLVAQDTIIELQNKIMNGKGKRN